MRPGRSCRAIRCFRREPVSRGTARGSGIRRPSGTRTVPSPCGSRRSGSARFPASSRRTVRISAERPEASPERLKPSPEAPVVPMGAEGAWDRYLETPTVRRRPDGSLTMWFMGRSDETMKSTALGQMNSADAGGTAWIRSPEPSYRSVPRGLGFGVRHRADGRAEPGWNVEPLLHGRRAERHRGDRAPDVPGRCPLVPVWHRTVDRGTTGRLGQRDPGAERALLPGPVLDLVLRLSRTLEGKDACVDRVRDVAGRHPVDPASAKSRHRAGQGRIMERPSCRCAGRRRRSRTGRCSWSPMASRAATGRPERSGSGVPVPPWDLFRRVRLRA